MIKTLAEMLTFKRPAGTRTERQFIARFIDTVDGMRKDAHGNRYLIQGTSSTMFSCHTDTVHDEGGKQVLDYERGVYRLADQKRTKARGCLGADDGAGVYTLLQLIEAKVPGLYVFHRGEEIGGYGSSYIAEVTPDLVDGIERCIAFDRRGTTDIITHQMMGRCCSDSFAWALSDAIGMDHSPCQFGTFTDSANYTDLIPECTNVAVGYALEHTVMESLDSFYLDALIDNLVHINWNDLPVDAFNADEYPDDNLLNFR